MKIAVLLSGGVDSSVALRLLAAERAHEVTAYYLKIWLEDELSYLGNCPWEEDLEYAREVCGEVGVPLRVVSLQREYFDQVVSYALEELRKGRTPSPDIFCNRRIKFGIFFERIGGDCDRIASGHYARIAERGGIYYLERSPDPVKDQTYFLSHMTQEQVARALFPIGAMMKSEVRSAAREFGLPNMDRRDSQGICFLGKIRYPDFVGHYLGTRAGEIRERETGRVLGEHRGYWFYTIGQRQGLGLGDGPWYVVEKDVDGNVVYVSRSSGEGGRIRNEFTVRDPNWISGPPSTSRLTVKLRHGPELLGCSISDAGEGRLEVTLDRGDGGIAPGQFGVFYDGNVCLGGAVIEG